MCNSVGTSKINKTGLKRQRWKLNFNFILLLNLYPQTAGEGRSTQLNKSQNFYKKKEVIA